MSLRQLNNNDQMSDMITVTPRHHSEMKLQASPPPFIGIFIWYRETHRHQVNTFHTPPIREYTSDKLQFYYTSYAFTNLTQQNGN